MWEGEGGAIAPSVPTALLDLKSLDGKGIDWRPGILTLIGTREVTLHPLPFLDQILSAEFSSKNFKLFCR